MYQYVKVQSESDCHCIVKVQVCVNSLKVVYQLLCMGKMWLVSSDVSPDGVPDVW